MRQVELVVQCADDDTADEVFDTLSNLASQHRSNITDSGSVLDIFVADDLGTVERP